YPVSRPGRQYPPMDRYRARQSGEEPCGKGSRHEGSRQGRRSLGHQRSEGGGRHHEGAGRDRREGRGGV
ncbi:hypothetical protein LTR28_002737, partial [Elasticomyces elasticus]